VTGITTGGDAALLLAAREWRKHDGSVCGWAWRLELTHSTYISIDATDVCILGRDVSGFAELSCAARLGNIAGNGTPRYPSADQVCRML
jgi:hypothetical protein